MTNDQLKELLQRYLTGQATDEDLDFIEKWWERTEEKEYVLDESKRAEIAARLLPKLHAIGWPEKGRVVTFPRSMLRIAAVLLLLIGAATIAYYYRYPLLDRVDPIPNRTITAGNYEIKTVVLPDSSRAILKNGSRISFPARYRGRERSVNMEGEVYFDVFRDPDHVFTVHSGQMDIRVLGTSFVVSDVAAATNAVVDVVSGRIAVAHGHYDLGELKAGNELTFDRRSGTASRINTDALRAIDWIHKTFAFNETPLESVFAAIESRFGVKFVVGKHEPEDIKLFTGMFSDDDSLKDILIALSLSTGIRYSTIDKNAIEIHYP